MIGDTPKGAPLRCRLGRHTGQDRGGLMVFQCGRCGGSFWQTDPGRQADMDRVRVMEARGDREGLQRIQRKWDL